MQLKHLKYFLIKMRKNIKCVMNYFYKNLKCNKVKEINKKRNSKQSK